MRYRLAFRPEQFHGYPEFEEYESLDTESEAMQPERGYSGGSLGYESDYSTLFSDMETEFSFFGFPNSILEALRKGLEGVAVRLAVSFGHRDENTLTNLIFFSRHPERAGRKLVKGEPGFDNLSREWLHIRDILVRPALKAKPTPIPSAPQTPSPSLKYGVPGGRIGSRFDVWRERNYSGYHCGIDVSPSSTARNGGADDPRRGLPVYLTLKPSIGANELNAVKVAYDKTRISTGLGVSSRSAAVLEQAKAIRTFARTKGDNAYGSGVGIACIYVYTKSDGSTARFTLYIEYLHLITRDTLPYPGRGPKISLEQWLAAGKGGQMDFGPQMKKGNTFTAVQLTSGTPLLVGYLGATRWPHVHIQVGFKHGVAGYIRNPRVDPAVMIY
jgi:hypothetical protein